MNKLKDIHTDKQDISIAQDKNPATPYVEDLDMDSLKDISNDSSKKDVSIKVENEIIIEKKRWKNFDSLEKKWFFWWFKLQKNIKIHKKKKTPVVFVSFIKFKRYLRDLWFFGWWITTLVLLIWIFFLWILDKIFIENRVNAWYEKILSVKNGNLNLNEIWKNINDARFDLLVSDILFFPFKVFSGQKIDSVSHVISGGRHLSKSLDHTLFLYIKTNEFIEEKSLQKIYFTQLLANIYPVLLDIEISLEKTLENYLRITWLPSENLLSKKNEAVVFIEKWLSYLKSINGNYETFLNIFWHDTRKRYLIVFQNADEIRPTWGFMGSMWLLELYKWRVQLFQKKDVYGIEWNLKKSEYERQPAPKWLSELTNTFWLRDANYYANVRDSSNSIKFFMDRAGIELDGIIYINQNILLKFLELTGPVYFEQIGREVTHENFSEIMSLLVEAKTFKKWTLGTPKQILFDFMEVFSQRLMSDAQYFDYVKLLIHDMESRDIMMWSFNEDENALLSDIWINGKIDYSQTLNFIYPVYTSLSGNKSDRYMKRWYEVSSHMIEGSCDYDIEIVWKSTHDMWKKKRDNILSLIDEYDLNSPNLFEIQWAARNRQYVRIVLPENAQISPTNNMEIIDYGSKKGVEFFLDTRVQETSYYNVNYTLKNPECKNYDFMLYKQAGIPEYDVEINIEDKNYTYFGRKEDFFFEKRDEINIE